MPFGRKLRHQYYTITSLIRFRLYLFNSYFYKLFNKYYKPRYLKIEVCSWAKDNQYIYGALKINNDYLMFPITDKIKNWKFLVDRDFLFFDILEEKAYLYFS